MLYEGRKSPWKGNWSRKALINEGFSGGKPYLKVSGIEKRKWRKKSITSQAMRQ
jgi:hypothetical protein